MYDSIIEAVMDAYEGENPWAYEDEVTNTIINEEEN